MKNTVFHYGVVEDNVDPFKLGRCRVRVAGIHTDNITELPTEDLPWAEVVQNVSSAALSGIGETPRLLAGSWVVVSFIDNNFQKPIIFGSIAGIPGSSTNKSLSDESYIEEVVANTPPISPPNPTPSTNQQSAVIESPYIGSLTQSQVTTLKNTIAQSETGGRADPYSVQNSIGFIGKYQFGAQFLERVGYIKKGSYAAVQNNTKIINNNSFWTGLNGVTSKELFFKKHDIQEALMDVSLKQNYKSLTSMVGLDTSVLPEKTAGLLMAAHLKGAGGASKYVKGKDSADANGTTTSTYYKKGYASIINKSTIETPTIENLHDAALDKKTALPPEQALSQDATKYDVGIVKTNSKQGFQDPSGKYPLKNALNESDLNRLARGSSISKTIVGQKEEARIKSVPVANSGSTWDQSPIPYGTVYPNNKVIASESGHLFEFDDTPGSERVNLHHSAGTFFEIDSEGNKVERVAGIKTIIIEENELVYIMGSGHVNIDGDMSIKIGGTSNIEITGNASLRIHGDFSQEITGNYNVKVGGEFNMSSGSSMSLKSGGNISIDGTEAWINSGMAKSALSIPSYSPSISIPAPISRQEAADMVLEDAEDITSVIYSDAPPPIITDTKNDVPAKIVLPVPGICGFTDLNASTILTANYKLKDLILTHTFPYKTGQHGLSAEDIACNLKQLAINVIEPLREKYSTLGFKINSCFREAGSKISKSKKISQHELGQAVDISFRKVRGTSGDREQFYNLANEIKDFVPFDQLLLETRSSGSVWIHISFKTGTLRRQILTLNNDKLVRSGLILLG